MPSEEGEQEEEGEQTSVEAPTTTSIFESCLVGAEGVHRLWFGNVGKADVTVPAGDLPSVQEHGHDDDVTSMHSCSNSTSHSPGKGCITTDMAGMLLLILW
jgi:hypothetical protein